MIVNRKQIVDYYAYNQGYIANKLHSHAEDLVLVEARGDSMHPIIQHGDVLTINMARIRPLEHAQLYLFNVDSDLIVKRVERRLTGIVLHSENPRYRPEHIPNEIVPTLNVLGQVILVSAPPR